MRAKDSLRHLSRAADSGDTTADAARADAYAEAGLGIATPEDSQLQRGQMILILTATHFFAGRLIGHDHEYLTLAPPVSMIFQTGDMSKLYSTGKTDGSETIPVVWRVAKGGVIAVGDWPFDMPPQ